MIVYMFYLVGDRINKHKFPAINSDEVIRDGNLYMYPYAWTADKSYRKQFKSIRDMNKFHEQILDVDDFEVFANSNNDTLLEFRRVGTKIIQDEIIIEKSIKILSTAREVNYASMNVTNILYSIISEKMYNDYIEFLSPNIYNKEFKRMLKGINMDDIIFDIRNMDKLPFNKNHMDSLNIYITAFANTYKK